jgi:hypothetical protein
VDLLVYDDSDRRYVPLLVALCGALIAAMIIGGLAYFLGQTQPAQSAERVGGVTAPAAGTQVDPTCAPAIERADQALSVASRLESALREQTSVMDDLLAKRVSKDEALDRLLPRLTTAAKDRQAFVDALASYQQVRAACQQ